MTILSDYIQNELMHVSPMPVETYNHFKLQLVNGENGNKSKYINITPEQFKEIEKILLTE